MMSKSFSETFVSYARGEITKCEMDAAIERLNADILKSYPKVPVKFSAEGTPYVDSSVSAISPRRLLALIRVQMSRRERVKE